MDVVPATPAPDFTEIEEWANTNPLSMSSLKGKVILLDCWTYTCVFCLRSVPIVRRLNEKYGTHGLAVVGAHSAEYHFALDPENIKRALKRYNVDFPVGFDTKNKTWEAYGNMYWPKHLLIDAEGFIRYEHAGYGHISQFEEPIIELLQEADHNPPTEVDKENPDDPIYDIHGMHFDGMSPEICVGYTRMRRFGNTHHAEPNKVNQFKDPESHFENSVYLRGSWFWDKECVRYLGQGTKNDAIMMKYNAKTVSAIMGTADQNPSRIEIKLDGEHLSEQDVGHDVRITENKSVVDVRWNYMHSLVKTQRPEIHDIEIIPRNNNFEFYTFVFG